MYVGMYVCMHVGMHVCVCGCKAYMHLHMYITRRKIKDVCVLAMKACRTRGGIAPFIINLGVR
jgi:hypothetical protein